MSRLEAAAKPILIQLIDGQRTIESLSPEEADIVGKWAVKTAYMHSWTSPLKKPVQLDHLKALLGDKGKPTSCVRGFGMQSDLKKPSAYYQRGHWPRFCKPELKVADEPPAEAYKIGLQFGRLYLLTAFWPDPRSMLTPLKGVHVPILQTGQDPLPDYSKDFPVGDGLIDQLAEFCNWLAVCHP